MTRSTRLLKSPAFRPFDSARQRRRPPSVSSTLRPNPSTLSAARQFFSGHRRRPPPLSMDSTAAASSSLSDSYVHVPGPGGAPESAAEGDDVAASDPIPNSEDGVSSDPPPNPGEAELDISGEGLGGPEDSPATGQAEERRVLPEELAKSVVVLECESSSEGGFCDVYLVGTAHVSKESCREVQTVIDYLKPQVVFLELCPSRIAILTTQNLEVPTVSEMIDMWKKKKMNTFGILYSWFLAKVADKLEVFPGSEFRVAFEEARTYGAKVILGDRPVNITLRRTWGKMTLWHRTKFLYHIFFQTVFLPSPEDLNKMLKEMDGDMLTLVIQEMSKAFPTLMETLLHERDMYMSSMLLNVAKQHSSVVAVVGKGHLPGIKKHWKQPIEVNHLLEVPTQSAGLHGVKVFTAVGVALAGIAVASGVYLLVKR